MNEYAFLFVAGFSKQKVIIHFLDQLTWLGEEPPTPFLPRKDSERNPDEVQQLQNRFRVET